MAKALKACVIGAGPNGLAAAIVLAQAGLEVDVYEAQSNAGGAARTMELTLPGFHHDFGSAVHPMAASSPFFSSLPLQEHGLEWVQSPAPLAHPLDDGSCVVLERDLNDAARALGEDGADWRTWLQPFVENWREIAPDILGPLSSLPRHPWLMVRFGMSGLRSAKAIAHRFRNDRTRALIAGLAAHSFLSLDEALSGAFAMMMAIPAHAVGWPIARGGSQAITDALCRYLQSLGGKVHTSAPIDSVSALESYDRILCDVTPKQLLSLAGPLLPSGYQSQLRKFRYSAGVFKADYALSAPIPWKAKDCLRAATVHLGGSFAEIAASEKDVSEGQHAGMPFVLLSQPTLFDPSRAPAGKHIAWAYCHVPNGSDVDMLPKIEAQIERFAPGFRETVLARRTFSTAALESMDANLVGGDISGGVLDLRQFLFRPTWRHYSTPNRRVFICSAATPPGGGVHGMCGYHAAHAALSRMRTND